MWAVVVLAAFAAETRYIQASSLNLRAEPTPEGAVRRVLTINTPVEVLSEKDAFAKVRVDGKEGWVAKDFLGAAPLDAGDAVARAERATDPAEMLSWLQRAAAIRPDDDAILAQLEAAYRSTGDAEAADRVARERRWPRGIVPVASQGPPEIELSEGQSAGAEAISPSAFERRFGFSINAAGWLLPDRGPAVKAQLAGAQRLEVSPCGSGWGTVAYVAGGIPYGRRAIAFTREAPPASWTTPEPAPTMSEDEARKAADGYLAKLRPGAETAVSAVPMTDGWFLRVARGDTPGIPDTATWQYVDVRVSSAGVTDSGVKDWTSIWGGPPEPVAIRDVNGDGALDLVQETPCNAGVVTLDGDELAVTANRCCD